MSIMKVINKIEGGHQQFYHTIMCNYFYFSDKALNLKVTVKKLKHWLNKKILV